MPETVGCKQLAAYSVYGGVYVVVNKSCVNYVVYYGAGVVITDCGVLCYGCVVTAAISVHNRAALNVNVCLFEVGNHKTGFSFWSCHLGNGLVVNSMVYPVNAVCYIAIYRL